jgi:hypothetical protein
MLIHSVTPAQLLTPTTPPLRKRRIKLNGGIAEGYQTSHGFVIDRLYSTDPMMFLKTAYTPGQVYNGRRK